MRKRSLSVSSKRVKIPTPDSESSRDPERVKDWSEWVAATAVRNHVLGDPLLDYLAYHSVSISAKHPQLAPLLLETVSTRGTLQSSGGSGPATPTSFTGFLMAKGCEFEDAFIALLFRTFRPEDIRDIGGSKLARSNEKFQDTIDAMRNGVPIIYSGVLHNPENKTYGVPDLIVRSDWINRLSVTPSITEDDAKVPGRGLFPGVALRDVPVDRRWHYRVVDIKFTTLLLKADGVHLLNSGSFPAYKSQLCIYNDAIGLIQDYTPPQAYLLGRKWCYVSRGKKFSGKSCSDRLGTVDFSSEGGADKEFIFRTNEAVKWVREMRSEGASPEWTLLPRPSRQELWPNMCNEHDHPFSKIKSVLSDEIFEITGLWMCGVKNRIEAHSRGIFGWSDPGCSAENLGVSGNRGEILDRILEANLDESDRVLFPGTISGRIENNVEGWQTPGPIEFFVDFEYTSDIADDFQKLPEAGGGGSACIFMIGVGHFEKAGPTTLGAPNGKWVYKSFIVDRMDRTCEKKICRDFSNYIQTESKKVGAGSGPGVVSPSPLLFHWSAAEKWQWSAACERSRSENGARTRSGDGGLSEFFVKLATTAELGTSTPRWFDLLEIFRPPSSGKIPSSEKAICVKGAKSFGLKKIAGALHRAGLINVDWVSDSATADGSGAMLGAFLAAKDAAKRGIRLSETAQIRDIERYNETDCRALGEIVSMLRNKFV